MKEYLKAIDYYTKIISIKPNHYPSYFGRGICYDIIYNQAFALIDYDSALKINKNNPKIWQAKADLLYNLGRISEASECYERALKLNPNNITCLNDYGVTLFETRKYFQAEKAFLEIVSKTRQNQTAFLYLAKIYAIIGHYDFSFIYLFALILSSPTNQELYLYDYIKTAPHIELKKYNDEFLKFIKAYLR
jgi:tetratricopeptide (TPR) repeat protein